MTSVKIGKYEYKKSTRADKKLMTKVDGKTIHFGASGMEHYNDQTGLLDKKLNHNDPKRRKAYRDRHGVIKTKDGSLAKDDPSQPAYHSWKILW